MRNFFIGIKQNLNKKKIKKINFKWNESEREKKESLSYVVNDVEHFNQMTKYNNLKKQLNTVEV